jgi:hypothetical protein
LKPGDASVSIAEPGGHKSDSAQYHTDGFQRLPGNFRGELQELISLWVNAAHRQKHRNHNNHGEQ